LLVVGQGALGVALQQGQVGAQLALLQNDPQGALAHYEQARSEAPLSMQYLAPQAYYAYVLALAGNPAAASAQLAKVRTQAADQFEPEFQLFAALDYVESLIPGSPRATPQGRAEALKALAAAYPVPVKLPLSPLWFGQG